MFLLKILMMEDRTLLFITSNLAKAVHVELPYKWGEVSMFKVSKKDFISKPWYIFDYKRFLIICPADNLEILWILSERRDTSMMRNVFDRKMGILFSISSCCFFSIFDIILSNYYTLLTTKILNYGINLFPKVYDYKCKSLYLIVVLLCR